MTRIAELIARIDRNIEEFERSFRRATRAVRRFERTFVKAMKSVRRVDLMLGK